jgi:hypothetical protein
MSVQKPSATALYATYLRYFSDDAPCGDQRIRNQCAVRLSVALVRCGFELRDQDFDDPARIHRGRSSCQLAEDHVVGAEELQRALVRVWGPGELFTSQLTDVGRAIIGGRWGIIYFNNCFTRLGQRLPRGDHIDLWTGTQYMNQVLCIGAGGNAAAQTDLFGRSSNRGYYMRFFFLPA